jgi:hypothetical protein
VAGRADDAPARSDLTTTAKSLVLCSSARLCSSRRAGGDGGCARRPGQWWRWLCSSAGKREGPTGVAVLVEAC